MLNPRGIRHRSLLVALSGSMLAFTGCFAMVAGVHQDMHFKSEMPAAVDIQMDGKTCTTPCTLVVRRQFGELDMQATQNGKVIAQGPIERIDEYAKRDCDSTHDNFGLMMVAAAVDGLLIVPGVIDLSTGILAWHPDTVVIEPAGYRVEDRCFDQPITVKSAAPE